MLSMPKLNDYLNDYTNQQLASKTFELDWLEWYRYETRIPRVYNTLTALLRNVGKLIADNLITYDEWKNNFILH